MMNEEDEAQLPAKSDQPSGDQATDEAMEEILMEVRKLIADMDNPFTLLGKLVAVLGRDKVVEELGDETLNEEKEKAGTFQGGLAASPGMMDALALQQLQRGAAALESEARTFAAANSSKSEMRGAPAGGAPPQKARDSKSTKETPGTASQPTSPVQDQPAAPRPGAVDPHFAHQPQPAGQAAQPSQVQQFKAFPDFPGALLPPDNGGYAGRGEGNGGQGNGSHQNSATMDFMKRINSLELSNFLTSVFGKERTIGILGSYESRGWISDEVAKMLVDCVTLIDKAEFDVSGKKGPELQVEDHQVALFLLDEFTKSLFNVNLSLRFREMMAAMKAAVEVHFPIGVLDLPEDDKA